MRYPHKSSCLLLLISAMLAAQPLSVYAEAEDVPATIRPLQEKRFLIEETVTIDDNKYRVPVPWIGHRITSPKFTPEDFKQIPRKHCKNGSAIYILAKAHEPMMKMFEAALQDGIHLLVESGYRSIAYQRKIFTRKLAEGRTFEDIVRYVAPPGYSQHMLGIALDFSPSNWKFASTEEYQWLKNNASRFGFYEVYSEFNETRMPWEAWHWSYMVDYPETP